MLYLINSQLRTNDQLDIETYANLTSNNGNISMENPIIYRPDLISVKVGNLLSVKTGEQFNSSMLFNTYRLNITSSTCKFKFNFNDVQSNNSYNILGITPSNEYTNDLKAEGNINNSYPIFYSNIISVDILKNSFNGIFNIYPTNYTIEGLCRQVENTLIYETKLNWNVNIINSNINGNITNRISIDCLTPNYKFLFYWTSNLMYNISNSFGFSTNIQSNIYTSNLVSNFLPLNNCFITSKDELYFNTEETITNNKSISYSINPRITFGGTFILNLQNILNRNINDSTTKWIVSVSNITNKITIKLDSNINTDNTTFQFLFSKPEMIRIAKCLGFNLMDTTLSNSITGQNVIDRDTILLESDTLLINLNKINNLNIYKLYNIPLSTPLYNPVDCINQINNKLINITNKPWNIVSNNNGNINNNSYLQINIDDIDSSFKLFWGNVYSNNISKALGFSNINMNEYNNNIIADNIINFNSNLDYNDKLYGNIRSNIYYKLTDFTINTTIGNFNLNEYLNNISDRLFNATENKYIFTYLADRQKVQIYIKDNPNIKFRILFGQDDMKNIAKMLGFDAINTPDFTDQIISNNIVNGDVILSPSDKLYLIEKQINPSTIITRNNIQITQPYFNSNNFINNLSNILNNVTGKNWSVTNNLNFLTINILSPNCAFKFLWGDTNMRNISYALGFHSISGNTFVNSTRSQFIINQNIQFNTNDILILDIRDTNNEIKKTGDYNFSISLQISTFNTFVSSLSSYLQRITNKLFRTIVNEDTKKITILTDSSDTYFKIKWNNSLMSQISLMLGFKMKDTPNWVNSMTGEINYDENITLFTSNIFFIEIAVKTPQIDFDQIITPFNVNVQPMFFYPGYFFQYINNLISSDLEIPLSIVYNDITNKITISSSTKFILNFGNLLNLPQIMGFDFNISPSYEYSFTSVNKINMTLSILPNDILNILFFESLNTYDINFYDFYANIHIDLFKIYMYQNTRLLWESDYNSSNQTMSIFLKSNKFKLITTDPVMNDLCVIYGFDPNNLNDFQNKQTSPNKLSFSTYINSKLVALQNPFNPLGPVDPIEENNIVIYSLQNNFNKPVLYSLIIEPIIFTETTLIKYLQNKLNSTIVGLNFEVTYDTNTKKIKIEIINTASQIKFRFLFGVSTFIDRFIGFNRSNINEFSYSITGEKEINLSSQFGQIIINPNSIIQFNKLKLCSINLPDLENITYSNNFLTIIEKNGNVESDPRKIFLKNGYYIDITIPLQTSLNNNGLTGIYTVSLSNKQITINSTTHFKILWNKNKILSNMCGFNPIEPVEFSSSITSDFLVDFVYPKYVYIDIFGLKYKSQIINNKHVFIININSKDFNQFNTIIECPNNNLNKLIFTLYDENNTIISPVSNWEALIDFME